MIRPPPRSTLFPYTRSSDLKESRGSSRCATTHPPGRPATVARRQSSAALQQRRKPRRSEEHTSELQSHVKFVCGLLLDITKQSVHHYYLADIPHYQYSVAAA